MARAIQLTEHADGRRLTRLAVVSATAAAFGLLAAHAAAQDAGQQDARQDRTERVAGERGVDQWDYWEVGYPDHPDVDQRRDVTADREAFHVDYWYDRQDFDLDRDDRWIRRPVDLDDDDIEHPYYLRYSTLRDDVRVDEEWGTLEDIDLDELRAWRDRPTGDGPLTRGESTIRGKLKSFRHIDLTPAGEDEPVETHTVAQITLESGISQPVALGPRRNLDPLQMKSGELIVIHGRMGTINGHPVMMANEIVVPERQIAQRIDRDHRRLAKRDQQRETPQRPAYAIRGTVEDARQIELKGEEKKHTLLMVNLKTGDSVIANLGPAPKSIADLDLEEGDEVTIRGTKGTINDRSVVMASRIEVDEAMQQRTRAERTIANWPSTANKAANAMIEKYGRPDGVIDAMLVWHDAGDWAEIIVHRNEVDHQWPMPHKDVLEQAVMFKVPADRMDELATFDSSIIVYQTAGRVAARCHNEAMNRLALNLAHEVVQGKKSPTEARSFYEKTAKAYQAGEASKYTAQLLFKGSSSN